MAELEVPGATINYEVWEGEDAVESPWLTLINGHTRPLNDFRLMGKHMVAAGYRVLAFDNRGAGKTQISDGFTLDDMAHDVVALWNEVGANTTRLLGISMGGFISQKLAAEQASRVEKLVLVSTAPGPTFLKSDGRPWTRDIEQVQAKLRSYFTASFAERNKMLVQSMAKQIASAVDGEHFAQRSEMQRRAIAGFDMTSRLAEVKCPTLIVHGDEDEIIPVLAARALAQGIKGSKVDILSGAGHLLLAEQPQGLYALVKNFLKN